MALYSQVKYTGNGTTTEFVIPISVYPTLGGLTVLVDGVAASPSLYNIAPTQDKVVFKTAPASGKVIDIKRVTKIDKLQVDFQSGAILQEKDLDDAFLQLISLIQENRDIDSERYQVTETAPAFPSDGFIWHKKSTTTTYMYDGSAWLDLHLNATQAASQAEGFKNQAEEFKNQASASATAAKTSETNAGNSLSAFESRYKEQATAPTPVKGMLWYDTTNDILKVYNGTKWVEVKDGEISSTDFLNLLEGVATAPVRFNTGKLQQYNGTAWVDITNIGSGHIDLSAYTTKTYVDGENAKQDIAINTKADKTAVYTKAETDSKISNTELDDLKGVQSFTDKDGTARNVAGTFLAFNDSGEAFPDLSRLTIAKFVNAQGGLTRGIHNIIAIDKDPDDGSEWEFTISKGHFIGEMLIMDVSNWKKRGGGTLKDIKVEIANSDETTTDYTLEFKKYGNNGSIVIWQWNGATWVFAHKYQPISENTSGAIVQRDQQFASNKWLISNTLENGGGDFQSANGNKIDLVTATSLTSTLGGYAKTDLSNASGNARAVLYEHSHSGGFYTLRNIGSNASLKVVSDSGFKVKADTNMGNLTQSGIDEIKKIALTVPSSQSDHANKQVFTTSLLSKSPNAFNLTDVTDSSFIPQLKSMQMTQRSGGSITDYQVLPSSPTYIKQDSNRQATIAFIIYIPKSAAIDYDSNSGMVRQYQDGTGNLGFKVTYSSKKHQYFAGESAGTIDNTEIHEYKLDKEYTLNSVVYDRYVYMSIVMSAQRIGTPAQNRITPVLNADMPDTATAVLPFSMVAEAGVLGQITEYLNPIKIVDAYTKSETSALLGTKADTNLSNVSNADAKTKMYAADPKGLYMYANGSDGWTVHTSDGVSTALFPTYNYTNKTYRKVADSYTKAEVDTKVSSASGNVQSTVLTKTTSGAWTKKAGIYGGNAENMYTGARLKTDGTVYIFNDPSANTSTTRSDNTYVIWFFGRDSVAPSNAKVGDTVLINIGDVYIDTADTNKTTRLFIVYGDSSNVGFITSNYATFMFRYDGTGWRLVFNDTVGAIRDFRGDITNADGNIIPIAKYQDTYEKQLMNVVANVEGTTHTLASGFNANPNFVLRINDGANNDVMRALYRFDNVTTNGQTYTGTKIDATAWGDTTWQITRISNTTFTIDKAGENIGTRRILILQITEANVYTRAETRALLPSQTASTLIYGAADGSTNTTNGTLQLTGSHTWAAFDEVIFDIAYSNGTNRTQQTLYMGKAAPVTSSNGNDARVGDSTNYVNFNWNSTNRLTITGNSNFGISRIYGKVY